MRGLIMMMGRVEYKYRYASMYVYGFIQYYVMSLTC